ncbi:LuxR C-terminal-related transcriptional regulator [Chloroflexi bacterium TSY]|nr:LuxR C-terminal-related transcriptional regulator [Chloroflexi bacterium TSY]
MLQTLCEHRVVVLNFRSLKLAAMIILTTKLHIPSASGTLVTRNQLFARLDEALNHGHRLTLVAAPAGFGKTTLITAWLDIQQDLMEHVAWISLGESDNDPIQFIAYVAAALDAACPGLSQEILPLLQVPQHPSMDAILTTLINYIDNSDAQSTVFLVLDDYHVIENQAIHDAMSFLLDHLPPFLHLIITSRTEPALPLARYRARNQITEIRSNDLRFNADEIGGFFQARAGIHLEENEAFLLAERTEGWAAALQFAALSLQNAPHKQSVQQIINSLSGRNRQIVDYLLVEVMAQQPPDVQQFLLRTSILERFNADLCSFITGQSNAQSLLEDLERTNLFTIPLDDERLWYRYHHLFAELLRNRLARQAALEEIEVLHATASRWFEENGHIDEAIDHAFAVQDEDRVAMLIQSQLQHLLWGRGMISHLWRWLDQLSDQVLLSHPRLAIAGCHSHILAMNVDHLTRYLLILEQIADLPPDLQAQYLIIRATVIEAQGNRDEGHHLAKKALSMLPDDDPETKAVVLFSGHIILERYQPWTTVRPWMVEALEEAKACNNYYLVGYLMRMLVWVALARGEHYQAMELCCEALELAKSKGGQMLPAAGFAHFRLGDLYVEWDDVEKAMVQYETALDIGKKADLSELILNGYIALIFRLQRQKNETALARVRTAFNEHIRKVRGVGGRIEQEMATLNAAIALNDGDLEAVGRWVDANDLTVETVEESIEPMSQTSLFVHYLLALSKQRHDPSSLDGVSELLEKLIEKSLTIDYVRSTLWYGLLQVRVQQQLGQIDAALNTLATLLTLAEPGGYVRLFVEADSQLEELLQMLQARGIHPAYIERLLDAFAADRVRLKGTRTEDSGVHKAEMPIHLANDQLIEPLTERELEVLQLVVDGLKNEEIAEQLIITIGTVKRHLSNIYGKLGVNRRTQAVRRAKELNLLASASN